MTLNGAVQGTGPFRVQGSSVHLNNSATPAYTIADANTIRDRDGDYWRKSSAALSGTYSYTDRSGTTEVIFNGNEHAITSNGRNVSAGPYIAQGSSVFLTSTATPYFTVVDANTLRDRDGDLWKKGEATATPGTVTISGLSSHSGKYIVGMAFMPNDKTLFFCANTPTASSVPAVQIPRNGTVTLNVYTVDHPGNDIRYNTAAPYSGSDNVAVGKIRLVVIETNDYATSREDINFENTQAIRFNRGNATINFSRQTKRE